MKYLQEKALTMKYLQENKISNSNRYWMTFKVFTGTDAEINA